MRFAQRIARAAVFVVGLAMLAACGVSEVGEPTTADWQSVPARPVLGDPRSERAESAKVIDQAKSKVSDRVVASKSEGPAFQSFKLAFTGTTADVILRRLTDWAGVQFMVPDGLILKNELSMNVQVREWADVVAIVDWIAANNGLSVKWRGLLASFSVRGDVGGNTGGSSAPAYLVRSAPIAEELTAIARERFGVACAPYGRLSVCLGAELDIADAQRFFNALDGAYGRFGWRVLESPAPVDKITAALGVDAQVVAAMVGPERWLIASADERFLDLVQHATSAAGVRACQAHSYLPHFLKALDLVPLLAVVGGPACQKAVVIGNALFWESTVEDGRRAVGQLLQADRAPDSARLLLVIAQEAAAVELGLTGQGVTVGFPNMDLGDGINLLVNLSRAQGWRTLEVTTTGKGQASITQTDRIQGDTTLTTAGNQIIAREQRSVGLRLTVDGVVTTVGFRGDLAISDTVLDGQVEKGANCDGNVTVGFGNLARVCGYSRADRAAGFSLDRVSAKEGSENFVVIAALLAHEVAAVETLRVVMTSAKRFK